MDPALQAGFQKTGLAGARRHLFVCIGPDCCASEAGEALWAYVKQRVRETGLPAMRTKAACLRVCCGGPWLVVYPEGIWYGQLDAARFERILQEHLIGGVPVVEWVAARNGLDGAGGSCAAAPAGR
jgi:(2Fe-2S) ferredoxin